MGYLLKRNANKECNQPKREKCVAVNKGERSWRSEEIFDIKHGNKCLEFAQLAYGFAMVQYLLIMIFFAFLLKW